MDKKTKMEIISMSAEERYDYKTARISDFFSEMSKSKFFTSHRTDEFSTVYRELVTIPWKTKVPCHKFMAKMVNRFDDIFQCATFDKGNRNINLWFVFALNNTDSTQGEADEKGNKLANNERD